MTKEEKIQEAYGELFNEKVDENGWSRVYVDSDKNLIKYFLNNKNLFETKSIDFTTFIRPIQLKGIENNNGWNLLTGTVNEIHHDDGDIWILNKFGITELWLESKFLPIGYATHWKPVIKPELPIY